MRCHEFNTKTGIGINGGFTIRESDQDDVYLLGLNLDGGDRLQRAYSRFKGNHVEILVDERAKVHGQSNNG